jgi:hypothetical protein
MNGYQSAHQIPARGGIEQDVFTGWRRVLCYLGKPRICRWAKTAYNRRQRRKKNAGAIAMLDRWLAEPDDEGLTYNTRKGATMPSVIRSPARSAWGGGRSVHGGG